MKLNYHSKMEKKSPLVWFCVAGSGNRKNSVSLSTFGYEQALNYGNHVDYLFHWLLFFMLGTYFRFQCHNVTINNCVSSGLAYVLCGLFDWIKPDYTLLFQWIGLFQRLSSEITKQPNIILSAYAIHTLVRL